ncbi:MAG TPA: hypothetical protein VFY93_09010 [Planctomycetota bacterium]|nr:hypothetical protein [Planctomycetota bacterium]
MSRKLVILLGAIVGGCGGAGGSAPVPSAEALLDGPVGATLDTLLGAIDLAAADARGGDARVRGEPVRILLDVAPDGSVDVEAVGSRRTEATLRLVPDPDKGTGVTGTITTESPDGTLVEATLERVYVRTVADLPGVGTGAVFSSGNVDFEVRSDGDLVATGTAALIGRRAVVALTIAGEHSTSTVDLN